MALGTGGRLSSFPLGVRSYSILTLVCEIPGRGRLQKQRKRPEASAVIFRGCHGWDRGGVGHGKKEDCGQKQEAGESRPSSVAGAKWKVRGQEARRDEEGNVGGDVTVGVTGPEALRPA